MSSPTVRCDNCKIVLEQASDLQVEKRTPCPNCGSLKRLFAITLTAVLSAKGTLKISPSGITSQEAFGTTKLTLTTYPPTVVISPPQLPNAVQRFLVELDFSDKETEPYDYEQHHLAFDSPEGPFPTDLPDEDNEEE